MKSKELIGLTCDELDPVHGVYIGLDGVVWNPTVKNFVLTGLVYNEESEQLFVVCESNRIVAAARVELVDKETVLCKK